MTCRSTKTPDQAASLDRITKLIQYSKLVPGTLGFILLAASSCSSSPRLSYDEIGQELVAMKALDQQLNQMVADGNPESRTAGFELRKRRVYEENTARIQEIFRLTGYPSPALVGEKASDAFWLLTQHSDEAPKFQEEVLNAMKPLVLAGQVENESLALLTDRVRINTGRPQVYGTQVEFDLTQGKAKPKLLELPRMVDDRRTEIGLEPLWKYMNETCEFHFMMNKAYYTDLGVEHAWQYPEGFSNW